MTPDEFYIIGMRVDIRELNALWNDRKLPVQYMDKGYIVHCFLNEAFGKNVAPRPFYVQTKDEIERRTGKELKEEDERYLHITGYTDKSAEELKSIAEKCAKVRAYRACDWQSLRGQAIPTYFPEGTSIQFKAMMCPVRRQIICDNNGRKIKEKEKDAFLSKVEEVNDRSVPIERKNVYREWLKEKLDFHNTAEAHSIFMTKFSIDKLVRRDKKRKAHIMKRPVVELGGELDCVDTEHFWKLLRYGVGKHGGFGFGMIRIKKIMG